MRNSRTNISDMNNIRHIRQLLGLSQKAFGDAIGVSQGNVSFYELGQDVPPKVARKMIDAAAMAGISLSYDDIYSDAAVAA
jgi:putative transcriptional regulator